MRRILVIDDSATMRSLYKQLLTHVPQTSVSFATDGAQGIERYEAADPHLIFLDINMPNMNGLECLAELKKRGWLARTRVVMVSTEGTSDDIQRGLSGGATEYLRKPFKLSALGDIVNRLAPLEESVTVRVTGDNDAKTVVPSAQGKA
jgi:two-component system chemotaxis response regulator CheY